MHISVEFPNAKTEITLQSVAQAAKVSYAKEYQTADKQNWSQRKVE